jgi:hypothetical protein
MTRTKEWKAMDTDTHRTSLYRILTLAAVLAVAVTVWELPSANVPPPLTVPSAGGEALRVSRRAKISESSFA